MKRAVTEYLKDRVIPGKHHIEEGSPNRNLLRSTPTKIIFTIHTLPTRKTDLSNNPSRISKSQRQYFCKISVAMSSYHPFNMMLVFFWIMASLHSLVFRLPRMPPVPSKLEKVSSEVIRLKYSLLFNITCLKEEVLPTYRNVFLLIT